MEAIPIHQCNEDAIKTLESTLEKAKSGELRSVAIAWVTKDNAIGGDVSTGYNDILMFASLQHSTNSFYQKQLAD